MGVHRYENLIFQKNFFIYISMGVHRKKIFIFVRTILDSLINGSTQEKVLTYLFFSIVQLYESVYIKFHIYVNIKL